MLGPGAVVRAIGGQQRAVGGAYPHPVFVIALDHTQYFVPGGAARLVRWGEPSQRVPGPRGLAQQFRVVTLDDLGGQRAIQVDTHPAKGDAGDQGKGQGQAGSQRTRLHPGFRLSST
ncbi:hypothetical protein D3C72_941080 [compost metagenome]